jgi:LL-diaminopimelate aminotransferase
LVAKSNLFKPFADSYAKGIIMAEQTVATGARLNPHYRKLAAGYLFPEINRRVREFEKEKGVKAIRLGIGDTVLPLTATVVENIHKGADRLGNQDTYKGYGDEQGEKELRAAMAEYYKKTRDVDLAPEEFFISDGAKCDSANIQSIFDINNRIAVQDPAYPVYVDTNVIAGRTGEFMPGIGYEGIVYMPCTPENGFIPELPKENVQLIYICSPNNPTGAVMPREPLQKIVNYARKDRKIILYDSAYSMYVKDRSLPRSIYEMEGARECAIELSSFSKWAGFTGFRLGWSIVPKTLVTADSKLGDKFTLWSLWNRRYTTCFNGAGNVQQWSALNGVLSAQGLVESQGLIDYYMTNAGMLRKFFEEMKFPVYGGENAPYIWVDIRPMTDLNSWEFFDKMLSEAHVVVTPGSGFGPSGEGFIRVSAFNRIEAVRIAIDWIRDRLKL